MKVFRQEKFVYYAILNGTTFQTIGEILRCDRSNKSYCAVLSCDAVCYIYFLVSVDETPTVDRSNEIC